MAIDGRQIRTMIAVAAIATSALGGCTATRSIAGPATRATLDHPGAPPMSPIADATDAQLREYWQKTVVGPLRSGRLRGRICSASGRALADVRVATVLTAFGRHGGREPARPEAVIVTDADGSFELPASLPADDEQFMLHVQLLPYVLQVWVVGGPTKAGYEARAQQTRREGIFAPSATYDPVAARAMMARGELMPSTAVDGGIDVIVRHLADDAEHAAAAARPPDTLADVTQGGKFQSTIDETATFPDLRRGDILMRWTVRPGPNDDAPRLIRAPADGVYAFRPLSISPYESSPEAADRIDSDWFVLKGQLIGTVKDKQGQLLPITGRAPDGKARVTETGRYGAMLEPSPVQYGIIFLKPRPQID